MQVGVAADAPDPVGPQGIGSPLQKGPTLEGPGGFRQTTTQGPHAQAQPCSKQEAIQGFLGKETT